MSVDDWKHLLPQVGHAWQALMWKGVMLISYQLNDFVKTLSVFPL